MSTVNPDAPEDDDTDDDFVSDPVDPDEEAED